MIEHGIDKVEAVPRVHDPAQPDDGATTAALVAVYGTPIDGGTPVYDTALGYCVWQVAAASTDFAWLYLTTIDETGATVLMTDDDGNPIPTYGPVT